MRTEDLKRDDPLRAKETLRIEKSRRQQRDGRNLPSWYYRVLQFSYKGDGDVKPWDFDEDISDLEEDKTRARGGGKQLKRGDENEGDDDDGDDDEGEEDCESDGEDPDCDCQSEGDDYDSDSDDDVESERSYDGSDADCYYNLKEMRDERKRDILQEKLAYQKEKEQALEQERAEEKEALAAHKSLKKGQKQQKIRLDTLAAQEFKLFCSDYIGHFYMFPGATKSVIFYRFDGEGASILGRPEPDSEANMVYGDIYLNAETYYNFGPFRPPKRATGKAIKVKTSDGNHELSFKFIGNGFLKLKVSRELVSTAQCDPFPPDPRLAVPEVFKFVGIKRDRERRMP